MLPELSDRYPKLCFMACDLFPSEYLFRQIQIGRELFSMILWQSFISDPKVSIHRAKEYFSEFRKHKLGWASQFCEASKALIGYHNADTASNQFSHVVETGRRRDIYIRLDAWCHHNVCVSCRLTSLP